jgi:hypothetical protein
MVSYAGCRRRCPAASLISLSEFDGFSHLFELELFSLPGGFVIRPAEEFEQ